ncbi:MAG: tetraacyldisaccharide 4-kinase [Proteobacteria bacterium]|nr:tetraacyldisaccharide 4-kinase [Pseudomonadota bacterium]
MQAPHDWLLETWYGGSRRGAWLLPLAWLFAAAAALRRGLYRAGLLRSYQSPRPVVVIGNVTVGGTGKTPLVVWLAERLAARGRRVGVASRGYGRSASDARRVGPDDPVAGTGDEPLLIARRTGAAVAVAADRPAAVRLLEPDCDVILSDDGLQHYALARDAEIAVVDGRRGLGNGWLLPAGPLRESPSRLAAASAVVVNGDGYDSPAALRMRIEPTRFVGVRSGEVLPSSAFHGRRAHAVAAIGHPDRFFDTLRGLGVDVDPHPLPDHAVPEPGWLAFDDGAPVLMTEKDAVKCRDFAGPAHWYLEVGARFAEADAERLLAVVEDAVRRRRPEKP